jgi:hypothetical protein
VPLSTIFLVDFAIVRTVWCIWFSISIRTFQIPNAPSIIVLCWHVLTKIYLLFAKGTRQLGGKNLLSETIYPVKFIYWLFLLHRAVMYLTVRLLVIPLTPERIINLIVHLLANLLTSERIINLIVHLLTILLTPERFTNTIYHLLAISLTPDALLI